MNISACDYARALLAASEGLPEKVVRERVEAFLKLLRRRGHRRLLPRVIEEAERLLESGGKRIIVVHSATPLSAPEKDALAGSMGIDPGMVAWDARRDPEAGPGVRVRIGDAVVDGTLRGRIGALRRALGA
jgi:F-type H+-transporting ATPase subunit delta